MIYRLLFIIILILVLFYPIFKLVNYLFIKVNIIKSKDLSDEYEKTLNKQKTIKEEAKQRIKEIEKEQEILKNIERN